MSSCSIFKKFRLWSHFQKQTSKTTGRVRFVIEEPLKYSVVLLRLNFLKWSLKPLVSEVTNPGKLPGFTSLPPPTSSEMRTNEGPP